MVARTEFLLFDTTIGPCGIAWNDRGLVAVRLPEPDPAAIRSHFARHHREAEPPALPDFVAAAIDAVRVHLDSGSVDLSGIPVDDAHVPDFDRRVYAVARAIPAGRTLTYGEVAERLRAPGAARAVGRALGANPWPIVVPCHRVLAAGGRLGGFSAPGGAAAKRRLLAIERARADSGPDLFDLPAG